MIAVLIAAALGLLFSLVGTPFYIRFLVRRGYGQFIRDDGPTSHHTKRGTPTMGGVVIILATLVAYFIAHLTTWSAPTASGFLVLFLMAGLGFVGFLDDFIKISKQRSLGLRSVPKLIGQAVVGITFAVLALQFPNSAFRRPASEKISFIRDTPIDLGFAGAIVGLILFVIWANLIVTAVSNGVNLTDGLDGLATGATVMVLGAYVLIGTWQSNQSCQLIATPGRNATKCAIRGIWLSSRQPSWARRSASSGGTRRRPRSSWATPVRWRSAARLPDWRSSAAPSCCSSCWADCSS